MHRLLLYVLDSWYMNHSLISGWLLARTVGSYPHICKLPRYSLQYSIASSSLFSIYRFYLYMIRKTPYQLHACHSKQLHVASKPLSTLYPEAWSICCNLPDAIEKEESLSQLKRINWIHPTALVFAHNHETKTHRCTPGRILREKNRHHGGTGCTGCAIHGASSKGIGHALPTGMSTKKAEP